MIAAVRPVADGGDPYTQVFMGRLYEYGTGVPVDLVAAAGWYAKAAAKNDPDGLGRLAYAYLAGRGVPKNLDRARELYRKAADTGNAHWEESFGLHYLGQKYTGDDEFLTDYAQAMVWLKKAADQGDANAMDWIGIIYRDGLGIPQDYAEAAKWYRRAADLNWRFAEVLLAECYLHGQGVPQDNTQAMFWYRKAADQGDPNAEEWVGGFYRDGTGVPVDFAQARAWFQKSADSGRQNGKTLLADLDARIAMQRAQTTQQLMQLMGQAQRVPIRATFASLGRIGPNDYTPSSDSVEDSNGLAIGPDGCSATVTFPPPDDTLNHPRPWSFRESAVVSILPLERSSLALETLSGPGGKPKEFIMTSVSPNLVVLEAQPTNKQGQGGRWIFTDEAQAQLAAAALQKVIGLCGGNLQPWQNGELQTRIDKALSKAGKPHTDWGSIMAGVVTALQPVTDSLDPNAIQNAANQQTANIQAAQARAAAAQAQAAQEAAQRTAAQQQAAQQQAAQQQAAAQAEAQRAAAAQRQLAQQQAAAQQAEANPPSRGAPGAQVPLTTLTGNPCLPVGTEVIHLDSKWTDATKSEVVAFYSNDTVGDVTCTAAFHKNGQWTGYAITFVPAGAQHLGGEQGGLWDTGDDSSSMRYLCFAGRWPLDSKGNSCNSGQVFTGQTIAGTDK